MKINQILIKPVLTEKATQLANTGFYTFQVDRRANKFQVKEIVEKMYKVKVDKIAIVNRVGKTRKIGRKMSIKQLPSKKLAIIKVREGKIDLFPQA